MKKIMFNVVSVVTALLVLVVMSSCGGGGGGGGGGSGASAGEQGEPSGNSNYRSSQAFPYGFFRTSSSSGGYTAGALWILDTNSNSALYFADATHARTVTRVGSGNGWERTPSDGNYEVEITSGANGYVRFTAAEAWPAKYAYDISDDVLVISNTHHGTRRYHRCPYDVTNPWTVSY